VRLLLTSKWISFAISPKKCIYEYGIIINSLIIFSFHKKSSAICFHGTSCWSRPFHTTGDNWLKTISYGHKSAGNTPSKSSSRQSLRQKNIFLPSILSLARKENWTLLSDGIVTYSPPSSPSISRHQLQIALPNHCQQSSSSNAGTGQQFQSCLERSRWKAIYLRNHRISNNWRFCRSNAVCHLRGHDEHVGGRGQIGNQ
jgi:hypothetical protein